MVEGEWLGCADARDRTETERIPPRATISPGVLLVRPDRFGGDLLACAMASGWNVRLALGFGMPCLAIGVVLGIKFRDVP